MFVIPALANQQYDYPQECNPTTRKIRQQTIFTLSKNNKPYNLSSNYTT